MSQFPTVRLRRLRQSKAWRRMTGMEPPSPVKFVWPVFVVEGRDKEIPIDALPGQCRYSCDRLPAALEPVAAMGIGGLMLFGVPERRKYADGRYAHDEHGLVQTSVRELRKRFPNFLIFTDVCLCAYTSHGHCGIIGGNGDVDNDATIAQLGKIAVSHAAAGVDGVAPSAMMDGQVAAIRRDLDGHGFHDTAIISYSTKFASAMYGPFREASKSAPASGDRQSYQASYRDARSAVRESLLDVDEGADLLMVKPALFYLDLIAEIRCLTRLPLAAYNVSGEYSMLIASANAGWGDLYDMVRESISAIQRAGADIIISYWANQYHRIFDADREHA